MRARTGSGGGLTNRDVKPHSRSQTLITILLYVCGNKVQIRIVMTICYSIMNRLEAFGENTRLCHNIILI